jgi:chitosanase
MVKYTSSIPLTLLALSGRGLAQSVDGKKFDNPTAGPPASYFAATTTIPVAALQSAAAKASTAASVATYPINFDSGAAKSTIYSDWSKFSEVGILIFENGPLADCLQGAAFVWVADMDVDCDGIDYKCTVCRQLFFPYG